MMHCTERSDPKKAPPLSSGRSRMWTGMDGDRIKLITGRLGFTFFKRNYFDKIKFDSWYQRLY